MAARPIIVNDVTGLNPIEVSGVVRPTSVAEVQAVLRDSSGPLSIGGGRFSMGGQTASPGSLHLDMRGLNRILTFSPEERTVRVQAGVRWCDIQRFLDPHDLAVKIMQSYANFTVGGSLSVNVHGRYIGAGPLILSVRRIALVLADGRLVEASPVENAEVFHGAIGGYGALGVIVEAELDVVPNTCVMRTNVKLRTADYLEYFRSRIRDDRGAVFHNADLYPPHFESLRAVTWIRTDRQPDDARRLMSPRDGYPLHRYLLWAITETPFGKWRREHIVDPIVFCTSPVHFRNYEAGYDVAELEPVSRARRTYVLQEYFVPVPRFDEFVPRMAEILGRHRVNVINVSVRHALPDLGSLLAWAREEMFAFVLYYKQRVRRNARERVAVWTRELIEAAIATGGTYYLPYQVHATAEQFHRAYPRAREFFALKRRYDPDYRFRGALWDAYYGPTVVTAAAEKPMPASGSDFHAVYDSAENQDAFYRFLQNIFHVYPEDRFHTLIKEACAAHADDEAIYRDIQAKLPSIKPFLADFRYALPALAKQKREMIRQSLEILGERRRFDGYLEIGSTGRYLSRLGKVLDLDGERILMNDVAPSNSPADIVERGGFRKLGRFVPLADYAPIASSAIPDASLDLVTCYIGLHHAPLQSLEAFVRSIRRVLRPGGVFVLRDHDVKTPAMHAFVALAHAVFNAGLAQPWETNSEELRHFRSVEEWSGYIESCGFEDGGRRLLQKNDPTDNVLMAFTAA